MSGPRRPLSVETGDKTVDDRPEARARPQNVTSDDTPFSSTMAGTSASGSIPAPPPLEIGEVGQDGELPTVDPRHYEVKREIARGGLGVVIEARDRILDRTVAIKRGLRGDDSAYARFVREAMVTAKLQHPSIIPVYEAGRWPNGEPFYAMKLVSGRPLRQVIEDAGTLDARLALLPSIIAVAEAMAFAHRERIIHRDLKPDNILLGQFGETVVIDWGLAKDLSRPDRDDDVSDDDGPGLGEEDTVMQGLTMSGSIMGTPEYMSPEQARGDDADERSDVYSIGTLLYYVLTGHPPYGRGAKDDILQRVIAGNINPIEVRAPRDLVTIVRKAMSREPAQRYPTAKELAEDLRRFETGQLLTGGDYSPWQLFTRWARKHRAVLAISIGALVALAVIAVLAVKNVVKERNVATHERELARVERSVAQKARATAEARNNELILVEARSKVDRDPTAALAWLKSYPLTAPNWDEVHEIAIDAQERGVAFHVLSHPNARWLAFSPDGATMVSGGTDKQLWTWDIATGKRRGVITSMTDIYQITIAPDGRSVAFGSQSGAVFLAELPSGAARRVMKHDGPFASLVFSPDGKYLGLTGSDGKVLLYDRTHDNIREFAGHTGFVPGLSFSPDSSVIATSAEDRTVRIWPLSGGQPVVLRGHSEAVIATAFSPDGKLVASASEDRTVRIWTASGVPQGTLHHATPVSTVAFAANGKEIIARDTKNVIVWRVATREQLQAFATGSRVYFSDLSADRRLLVAAGNNGSVVMGDPMTGDQRPLLGLPINYSVAVSPDGRFIGAIGGDFLIRIWKNTQHRSRTLHGHEGLVADAAFSPDGRTLATVGDDRTLRLWEVGTRSSLTATAHDSSVVGVAFSPDGKRIVTASTDRTVRLWTSDGRLVRILPHPVDILDARFSSDGRLFTATADGDIRIWSGDATAAPRILDGERAALDTFDISPDGSRIVTAGGDGRVVLWDLASGQQQTIGSHEGIVAGVSFLPDGRHVVSRAGYGALNDRSVRLWDLEAKTGRVLFTVKTALRTHAVSRDGKWIAIGGVDPIIYLVAIATGATRELHGQGSLVITRSLEFSPDGALLASGSSDGSVRVWDIKTGASQITHHHNGWVNSVTFTTGGNLLASTSYDETAWFGAIDPKMSIETDPPLLLRTIGELTSARIDKQDRATTP